MNKCIFMGRLTRDPEIRYTQSEKPVAVINYTLAVDRRYKREGEPSADFINFVAYGAAAEFAEKYFKKVKEGTIGKIIKDTDNITFYLYIDDNEQGKITNAKLYDVNGDLLESKDYNTPKDTLATATIGIRITIKRE